MVDLHEEGRKSKEGRSDYAVSVREVRGETNLSSEVELTLAVCTAPVLARAPSERAIALTILLQVASTNSAECG